MQIRLLEIAQIELDDSIDYYNSESDRLGDEFLVEALHALDRIKHFPQAWHPFTDVTRRCQLRRFPYGIIYQTLDAEILVIAVANLHRNPEFWKDRIKE
jgi:toxin ParE2